MCPAALILMEPQFEKTNKNLPNPAFYLVPLRNAQILDLLGEVPDIECIGPQPLGPGTQGRCLVLGPGMKILFIKFGDIPHGGMTARVA